MSKKRAKRKTASEQSLFMQRSASIYRHQGERAVLHGKHLGYSLAQFREDLRPAIKGGCTYCKRPLSARDFSVDHMIPISRNGAWESSNLAVCCLPCNKAKGELTGEEFLALLLLLQQFGPGVGTNVLRRLVAGGAMFRGRFARK